MHCGIVNDALEAVITLAVLSDAGAGESVAFAIDTGFTDALTLPQHIIDRLNLLPDDDLPVTMADGTVRYLTRYTAYVQWHSQIREVQVIAMGPYSPVGMGLLRDSNLSIDATPGGIVTVTELPAAS